MEEQRRRRVGGEGGGEEEELWRQSITAGEVSHVLSMVKSQLIGSSFQEVNRNFGNQPLGTPHSCVSPFSCSGSIVESRLSRPPRFIFGGILKSSDQRKHGLIEALCSDQLGLVPWLQVSMVLVASGAWNRKPTTTKVATILIGLA